MPAITLGVAEVEERLQALRWRLNSRTAQHSIYVASATAVVLSTILILAGLRGSPATFRLVVWASALLVLAVVPACAFYAWWRWADLRSVARLADDRAQLTDRLTTLVDLHLRQRTSRLAPVLVAQTLALGARWRPHRIAPRAVPRSVFLLVAALLALASTTVLERQTRRRADHTNVARPQPVAKDTPAAAQQTAIGHVTRASAGGDPAGTQAGGDTSRAGTLPGTGTDSSVTPANRTGSTGPSERVHDGPASLTDRLQQAIADTFRADTPDARKQPRGDRDSTAGMNARANADDALSRRSDAERGPATSEHARGAGSGTGGPPSRSGQSASQRPGGANAPQKFTGDRPGAGEGSSPQGLMQATAPELGVGASTSKPFTLKITSVPHAREAHGTAADRATRGPGVAPLTAVPADSAPALSERQLGDDALRKAEIPQEYEDVLRDVFTSRGGR